VVVPWRRHIVVPCRRPVSQRGGLGRRWEGGAYCVVLK